MTPKYTSRVYRGISAAPGLTAGPVYIWLGHELSLPTPYRCEDPEGAWQKILAAIKETQIEIGQMREQVLREGGKNAADIFDAHQMMVADVSLHERVRASLKSGINPEAAWHDSIEDFAKMLEDLPNPTLSGRAADVRDAGNRVLAHLLGKPTTANAINEPSVVIARDLTPSQTAGMDRHMMLAFCTAEGGPTSHTAILAKALGIPAIVAMGSAILTITPDDYALVDAGVGEMTINPDKEKKKSFSLQQTQALAQAKKDERTASSAAVTRDGVRVDVFANIGGVADAQSAIEHGADGVGLFRTEFLYLNRKNMPSVEEQVGVYHQVLQTLNGRPLVVRTLDIGGDKRVEYLGITKEPNPFLGWRGIRMINERPEIVRDQFYALIKAAQGTEIRIMVPMVSDVGEVTQARRLLNEALKSLDQEGFGYPGKYQFGIMVEVPSAALMIEHFAPHVDFYSIGTNDLTQYTLAVDRMNARVAAMASPFHPSVLKLIERTVRIAHEHGKWVGLCGELAGEPLAVPFLLGIGLDEFSMSADAIPTIKRIIRQLSRQECKELAEHALGLATFQEVQDYLRGVIERLSP